MNSSSKRRRLNNYCIEDKDIDNFNEDYRTDHDNKFMILHKPMVFTFKGTIFHNSYIIGSGSFSRVYKVIDNKNPNDNTKALAIKIFKSLTLYKDSAIKEINALRKLKECPFIIDIVIYFKITNNHIAIVTPFYDLNLLNYMERYLEKSIISRKNFVIVFKSLLNAILFMIKNEISSTDMKPENIFLNVRMDGTIETVVLGDFSSPLNLNNKIKSYNPWRYTKYYRPPEIIFQFQKENLKLMDLWSLGCVLYELHYYTQKIDHNSILFECDPRDNDLDKSNKNLFRKQSSILSIPPYSFLEKYKIEYCAEDIYINSSEYKRFKEPNKDIINDFSNIPFGSELIVKFLNWDPDERPSPDYCLEYIEK